MLLDDREHGLRKLINAPFSHLPVGDIWIGTGVGSDLSGGLLANGLCIERKSAADLEASILDNRYREQRSRLLAYVSEVKAHPVYIIEGDLDRLGARLKKPALMKHITRLSLRYHVTVFQTSCIEETAELCQLLEDQWKADPTTFEQPKEMTYIETRGKSRQENSDDPKVFAATMLMCCRGVSAAAAQALLQSLGSLTAVWGADEKTLAAVQCGKQKFGAARAQRLYSLLHA